MNLMKAACAIALLFVAASAFGADPAVDKAVQDAVKEYPPGDYPSGANARSALRTIHTAPSHFAVRAVVDSAAKGTSYILRRPDQPNEALFLDSEIILDQSSIKNARVDHDQDGLPIVRLTLTKAGAEKFGEASTRLLNKRVGFVLDDRLISAPVIRTPIFGGELILSSSSEKEAAEMAAGLNPP